MKHSITIVGGIIIVIAIAWFAMRGSDDSQKSIEQVAASISPATTPDSGQMVQTAPSNEPEVSPVMQETSSASVTVSVDDEGFTPATVTVKAGTAVKFVNNGQALHWPASDPHPIHTGLAGFDALKGLSTGETYSFTFTKAGTFGMHDHLNPRMKGTIIVQ